jgi:hypothetical protein
MEMPKVNLTKFLQKNSHMCSDMKPTAARKLKKAWKNGDRRNEFPQSGRKKSWK